MEINNPSAILTKSIEETCGLNQYVRILELRKINVATNESYQKNFTSYYRVRREASWLKEYYSFMEIHKNDKELSFETILRYISNISHNVKVSKNNPDGIAKTIDASFASKMLSTINTNYPIWDSQVVKTLGIKLYEGLNREEKIEAYIGAYKFLKKEVDSFIPTPQGVECIAIFDKMFPSFSYINPVKKIDFYLWNMGK